ncbi:hypothetical protein VFPPC_07539 [Pochonia chlamydosporia 170]|uniref:Uncharacterized protein n=1 Tax=Pochonia chlamydosporia 170 TaxID=1380566 RepID=A0A179FK26_METCM|nr:hypothetical protein VFPPC_07539 [Pochonia chlamydosporia 170]OAQ65912.1 hypothetical protein VFPPC_07539 [Pochonia chlamydosporia 170]
MPTQSQYFGYSVTNIGPLTTAFTPAPSCATATPHVYIETQLGETRGLYGYPSCAPPKYEGCLPGGKELDRLNRELSANPHNGNLVYHSPGLRCPSGWKKVGSIHGGTKTPSKPSGVFTGITTATGSGGNPRPIPRLEAYAQVLGPSETMVWCCPKGFVANNDAACTSDLGPLSSFTYSQHCDVYLPSEDLLTVTSYQGTILSSPLIVVTAATTGISSSTYSIAPSETSGLVVVSNIPVVALVYRPEDRKGEPNSTAIPEVDDNASVALKPNLLSAVLGTVLAAWAIASNF